MKYGHITTYSLLLLALLAFVACTQQEQEWVEPSDEATVTFSLTSEQAFGTRAYTEQDASQAYRLVCAVYDVKGNLLKELGKDGNGQIVMETNFSDGVSLPLRLVRGQEYKVVFWASSINCDAYDTSDLSHIKIDYEAMQCNDRKYDAFYKTETFTVSSDETKPVVLRRPFAQINVGISQSDYETLADKEITSSITLGPVANILNAVTNSVSADDIIEEVTFLPTSIPDDYFSVQMINDEGETTKETYKYLAMCYLLVADQNDGTSTYSSELSSLTVTLNYDGEDKEFTSENVPVGRNWSTNIFLTRELLEKEITEENNQ